MVTTSRGSFQEIACGTKPIAVVPGREVIAQVARKGPFAIEYV
jgi:hypothetical protein